MKAKKSANIKVPSRALHAKSRKDSCTNNVHPDVILDADEALRNILGRLTKLEDEVAPIKTGGYAPESDICQPIFHAEQPIYQRKLSPNSVSIRFTPTLHVVWFK